MSTFDVRNDTGVSLTDVIVVLPGRESNDVGSLPVGGLSARGSAPALHRFPAVRAAGPDGELVHLPFDGDHQPALPSGDYTYVLRLESGRLVVDLVPAAG